MLLVIVILFLSGIPKGKRKSILNFLISTIELHSTTKQLLTYLVKQLKLFVVNFVKEIIPILKNFKLSCLIFINFNSKNCNRRSNKNGIYLVCIVLKHLIVILPKYYDLSIKF